VGSPYYMAPELWIPGAEVDARSDVYALGVLTYEALAGHVPFDGGSVAEVARGHARGELPRLPGGLPGALDDVLARALAKAPGARYPGALAFAEAVRAASGLRMPPDVLPRLDDALRADTAWMPQPIADAIAAFEAARNPHQARDALWAIVRAIARWLGVLALAARSQIGAGATGDPDAVIAALRALSRRDLADPEWLELVRALTAPFAAVRDAYPIPELIDLAAADPSPFAPLFELRAREAATTSEETLRDQLAHMLPVLAPVLRAVAFLTEYPLVMPRGDRGELWMGPQRQPRPAIAIAADLPAEPVLVDLDGRPLLALAPLVQIAAPSPGAPEEVFVLAGGGRGRGGARLVADPLGFERHDEVVWDWLRAHVAAIDGGGAATVERVPYRGLAAFTEADADVFFGRERETQAFVNRLIVEPLLTVVGPSGAGKSSFVRAGVVPALPPGWRAVVLRPGPAPMAALAAHLERAAAPGETAVIVVDQFEELFTLCRDPAERQQFAAALAGAAIPGGRCRVVLTVRDDFLAQTGELAAFRDRLSRGVALLPVPGDDDLRRVIVEPARRAGYDFDDAGLPARMVHAVRGRSGALALISFTARQLWELRDRQFRRLTCRAYDAIGGVEGALARHAEDTLRACSGEEQQLVRAAFRHLVTAAGTRAVLTRDELDHVLGRTRTAAAVVERLVGARLVVVADVDGREQVEVVHEALLTAWPRLVDWHRDDVEGARLR
ncbi:MAG TPA: hypothetical protein VHW23_01690, partial [Kofleriaceae bacterium]|nr:hypothetical protein [Kofleriaceae bacterium]